MDLFSFQFIPLSAVLRQNEGGGTSHEKPRSWLPRQLKCAAHLLNLVASVDVKNAIEKCNVSAYKRASHSAFTKAHTIWRKQGKTERLLIMSM